MKPVAAESVTVGYGGPPVLREVSFTAEPGQLLAVTGPSGAGKTTLLRTLAGLLAPAGGAVQVPGQVALVPQDSGLATVLTAAENLLVALLAAGHAPGPARERTVDALSRLGLAGAADQLAEELSGGQQQRAALARGLALRPDVLLADEVTSELDAANRELVLQLLRTEAERGAVVVFATHDPAAAEVCDAELRLADGRAELVRGGPQPASGSAQPATGSAQPASESAQPASGSAQPAQRV